MTGGAESAGWEYYCRASEYMRVENLFLNSFIKMVNFLLNIYQVEENSRS
jgi:hypothetical protein